MNERIYNMNTNKNIKRFIPYIIPFILIIVVIIGCLAYKEKHSFSKEKWINTPEERALFVDDLLIKYKLIGMSEHEILNLLGENDNEMGTFAEDYRYVYCLGLEGQLFKIDNQWLVLDFANGYVVQYSIMMD